MQPYFEAIRRRVCSVCIDGIFDKENHFVTCGLSMGKTCPVELYLPQVIDVVESTQSSNMEDYVTVLRDKVCAFCAQDDDGMCALRLHADCALDRYFMLVAGAIEEVRASV
jgi:hypothetical protein